MEEEARDIPAEIDATPTEVVTEVTETVEVIE